MAGHIFANIGYILTGLHLNVEPAYVRSMLPLPGLNWVVQGPYVLNHIQYESPSDLYGILCAYAVHLAYQVENQNWGQQSPTELSYGGVFTVSKDSGYWEVLYHGFGLVAFHTGEGSDAALKDAQLFVQNACKVVEGDLSQRG